MRRVGSTVLLIVAGACALWFLLVDGTQSEEGSDAGSLLEEGAGHGALLSADDVPQEELATGRGSLAAGAGPSDPDDAMGALEVTGRVVDTRRRPIAGATVTLQRGPDRARSVTSDATGTYVFSLSVRGTGARQHAALLGRAGAGPGTPSWVGSALVWLPPGGGAVLAPTLVLEAGVVLDVRVVRDGAPVPDAQVAVTQRLASAPVVLANRRADPEGRLLVRDLPPGDVEVFAVAPGSGRGHAQITLPRSEGGPLEVVLGPERQMDVLVVDAATESPIAGAEVLPGDKLSMPDPHGPGYLPFARSLRTDRSGHARIVGIPAADVLYVNARAPGYALTPWWQRAGRMNRGTKGAAGGTPAPESEIRIALSRYRVVTFPVSHAAGGAPADGTALRVQLMGAARRTAGTAQSAAIVDGALEVRGLPNRPVSGIVIAPAGEQALFRAPAGAELGGVVTFRAAQEVRVRVVTPDGDVQPDVALRLDPLGKGADILPARTDAHGIANFSGVGADLVAVRLVVADRPAAGALLGRLDLKTAEDVYEVLLQRRLSFLVEVRVGDQARLPARYSLMAGNQRVGASDLEEEPELGRLRAWVRPLAAAGEIEIALHAQGYLPARARLELRGDVEAEVLLELKAAGSLVAVVTPPEDGTYNLGLQLRDEADKSWKAAAPAGGGVAVQVLGRNSQRARGGEQVFEGLPPGRYRVVDARSGSVSAGVVVEPGAAASRVPLDLSGAIWVQGRVRAPAGANLALARVLVAGRDEPDNVWSGVRADAAGTFRVRARRGETLTLRVTHPTLSPAATGGRISVRPGAGEVELRLEQGAQARFRLVGFEGTQTPAGGAWYAPLRVYLYADGADEPARVLQPVAESGTFSFGGFDPGTYRVLLLFGTIYAPLSVSRVALGERLTDLGTLTPSLGETVRIRWQTELPVGASLWATATHVGLPAYARRATRDKATGDLLCSGLGAGTFHVVVQGANLVPGAAMTRALFDKRLVLDGKGETAVDVAWR